MLRKSRSALPGLLLFSCCAAALVPATTQAVRDGSDVVAVTATADADSVTVGERFRVTQTFTFPDSLRMLPAGKPAPGKTLVIESTWRESNPRPGMIEKTRETVAMTLDLAQAVLPGGVALFVTESGDTLGVPVADVPVPVRHLAAQSKDLRPLKAQWDAPRSYTNWIVAAAAACVLAALAWFLWRRRRVADVAPEPKIALPPDYVALSELARIERLGLLQQEAFKPYYTLVVDAVRRYIEGRFHVEAMDRTTREMLDDLRPHADVPGLEALLVEADLVKFAKFVPTREAGEKAIATAREIVVTTTPVENPVENAVAEAG